MQYVNSLGKDKMMKMMVINSSGWWWLTDWTMRNDLSLISDQINSLHYDDDSREDNRLTSGPWTAGPIEDPQFIIIHLSWPKIWSPITITSYHGHRFECETSALIIECRDRSSHRNVFSQSISISITSSVLPINSREWFTSLCAGWLTGIQPINRILWIIA